jgi:large conductance mechanosensitive channel
MKNFIQEFKKFAVRGNVIDLAIGVIIGSAFNRIVTSLVEDIIMPPLGLVIGGLKFDEYRFILSPAITDSTGKVTQSAVTINYGNFIQVLLNFLIVALTIFVIIKVINLLRERREAEEKNSQVQKTTELDLLTEIRDLLKVKQSK